MPIENYSNHSHVIRLDPHETLHATDPALKAAVNDVGKAISAELQKREAIAASLGLPEMRRPASVNSLTPRRAVAPVRPGGINQAVSDQVDADLQTAWKDILLRVGYTDPPQPARTENRDR